MLSRALRFQEFTFCRAGRRARDNLMSPAPEGVWWAVGDNWSVFMNV